jgi:thymidylate synthase (FAD)
MTVTRIWHTPLSIAAVAGRTCWDSFGEDKGCYLWPTDNISSQDFEFLNRIINKHKHGSVAEHLTISFKIEGVSRACLQELARHRIQSLSVQSSRYVLKKLLKNEEDFFMGFSEPRMPKAGAWERAEKYVVFTGCPSVDDSILASLETLRKLVSSDKANDVTKYAMPEAFKTSLVSTWNMRSLMNFLSLRTSVAALPEIQKLAKEMFNNCPEQWKTLLSPYVSNNV